MQKGCSDYRRTGVTMPLVSMVEELRKAQAGKYAVPSFNTFEMMGFEGSLLAMEDKMGPGILGIQPAQLNQPGTPAFIGYIRARAEASPVPVSIILDHGTSFEECMQILSYGATDVMIDAGKLPLEENIEVTRKVVRAAHEISAGVEAELGFVGHGSDYGDPDFIRQGFTKPEEAAEFVEKTGVDALAVAIGSAHGVYKGKPELALDLLTDIRSRVDVPLVLHGGSGISDDQFRAAIAGGISKINIFTDLRLAAQEKMIAAAEAEEATYFTMFRAPRSAFRERCRHFLDVFGASGKAQAPLPSTNSSS
jgi:fructose-bisphosphate aldolase class II